MNADQSIPILPCRDLDETLAFYGRLGFDAGFVRCRPDAYAVLRRGGVELHFFVLPGLDPAASYSGCYVRVGDVAAWHRAFAAAGVPAGGTPRLTAVEDKPWGMREFALVDPSGNLVRVGQRV